MDVLANRTRLKDSFVLDVVEDLRCMVMWVTCLFIIIPILYD